VTVAERPSRAALRAAISVRSLPLKGGGIGGLRPPFLAQERRCEASAMVGVTFAGAMLDESA
jgi:hypothetical protein